MVLSILGTVMLIIGGLGSFAGASSMSFCLRLFLGLLGILTLTLSLPTIVLYALGTVVSLIGTGFLIGVRLNFFSAARTWSEQGTVPQAVETSTLACVLTSHSVVHHSSHTLSSPLPPDVQACPRCRDDRIPGYDHYDLHLGLCDR